MPEPGYAAAGGPQRNQLAWLDGQAWQQLQAQPWDAEAQAILAHWCTHGLPLVVCRQSAAVPEPLVCLGLPAPTRWSRRRLPLAVEPARIARSGAFPSLLQVAHQRDWGLAALTLDQALARIGVHARVYGSHGWEYLTGQSYLHPDSDIDLSVNVQDFASACEVAQQLSATTLYGRLDGEIVFPAGQAVAWRELQRCLTGQTTQLLVKQRHQVGLASIADVRGFGQRDAAHA